MAQTTILAAGITAATSTDVVLAAGAVATIGIFTDNAAGIPGNHYVKVFVDTPSSVDDLVCELSGTDPVQVISGPGTFRAKRDASLTTNVGVYTET